MARYFDFRTTILIVVGHGILPEEEDRPIAYDLKRAVNKQATDPDRSAVVVTDVWVMNNDLGSLFPAIAVGGPGVNALTGQLYEELPIAFTRDQRVFIQIEDPGKRAAVWGMDESSTREAVDIFMKEGLLERYLDLVWGRA